MLYELSVLLILFYATIWILRGRRPAGSGWFPSVFKNTNAAFVQNSYVHFSYAKFVLIPLGWKTFLNQLIKVFLNWWKLSIYQKVGGSQLVDSRLNSSVDSTFPATCPPASPELTSRSTLKGLWAHTCARQFLWKEEGGKKERKRKERGKEGGGKERKRRGKVLIGAKMHYHFSNWLVPVLAFLWYCCSG